MKQTELLSHALQLAELAGNRGDIAEAVFQASVADTLALELGDERRHAQAQSLLVMHLFTLGRFAAALRHGRIALQVWQSLQAFDRVCETKMRLAMSLSELDLNLQALELARDALSLAQQHSLSRMAQQAITMLGSVCARAGDADGGELLLLQALSSASEAGDNAVCTVALNALLALLLNELAKAKAVNSDGPSAALVQRLRGHVGPALARCSEEPDLFRRTVLRGNVAAALAACGRHGDALALQRACAQQAADQGFQVAESRSRLRLAELLLDRCESTDAAVELDRLQGLVNTSSHPQARLELLALRSRQFAQQGDGAAAAEMASQVALQRQVLADKLALQRQQAQAEAAEVLEQLAQG